MLHTGEEVDGMTLSSVLGDVSMNEVDNIRSDSDAEDSGKDNIGSASFNDGFSSSCVRVVDVNNLSMDHGDK